LAERKYVLEVDKYFVKFRSINKNIFLLIKECEYRHNNIFRRKYVKLHRTKM